MGYDWSNFKCRCSAIGKIMSNSKENAPLTEKQAEELKKLEEKEQLTLAQQQKLVELTAKKEASKELALSATCITYLMEVYVWEMYRKIDVGKEMDIVYTRKGKLAEADSIELLSFVDDLFYEKNDERIWNDFLTGEPDIFVGEEIMKAKKIVDTKSIWSAPGFFAKKHSKIDNDYRFQLQGYGDITGAKELEVAYCLVNTPEQIINDYRRKLFYQMGVATDESPEYKIAVAELENSMIFDDIPEQKRVFRHKVDPFTEHERQLVYDRVKQCREWLIKFDEMENSGNLK